MTKKQRVIAAIRKEPVDHVPSCFSLHFPEEMSFGQAAVDAHISFFRETGCDVLKIMNENLVPPIGEMNGPEDWEKVPAYTKDAPFMRAQLDMVERILERSGDDAFSVATIHGICASMIHPIEERYGYEPVRNLLCEHLRTNPGPLVSAMDRVADSMCELVVECVSRGVDGIYYAALGGEYHFFTAEEFAEYIEPYDKRILSAVRESGAYSFLHICKENLNMQRYANYDAFADVVNWGVYETNYSLEEGRKLFPNTTIMGGLANRSGVLVDGTLEELEAAVHKIISDFGTRGFILGADCTLPTEISYERIMAAVKAAVI